MQHSEPFSPGPHQLVGWERHVSRQLASLIALSVCALPILIIELELQPWLRALGLPAWISSRSARELTGFVAVGIVLFQLSLRAVKRLLWRHPRALRGWRTAHELAPIGLLAAALLHTRGEAGANLNRWLICVLLLQIFLVQAGHVAKALFAKYAHEGVLGKLDQAANTPHGLVHRIGLHLHVLLATAFAILLLVHVFAVYYF